MINLSILLYVLGPSIIHQPGPSEIYCPVGQKVTLTCLADGKPIPQLQWYLDGQLIADATETTIEVDLPGDYMCRATNRVGSVDSSTVAVAIVSKEGKLCAAFARSKLSVLIRELADILPCLYDSKVAKFCVIDPCPPYI